MPWDLLNRVKTLCNDSSLEVAILGEKDQHRSKSGLPISTNQKIEKLTQFDGVIFCSGPETRNLCKNEDFLKKIYVDSSQQLISGVCSGALFIGALGLLKGKKATTYPTAKEHFQSFGVNFVEESFVVEGNISTSASCLAGQYVAHWMISKLVNENIANKVIDSIKPLSEMS